MTTYPSGIYEPRTKANAAGITYDAAKTTVGYAEDVVNLDNEVVAIQTELGTSPKGNFASVKKAIEWFVGLVVLTWSSIDGWQINDGSVTPLVGSANLDPGNMNGDILTFYHKTNDSFAADLAGHPVVEFNLTDADNVSVAAYFGIGAYTEANGGNFLGFVIGAGTVSAMTRDEGMAAEHIDEIASISSYGTHTYRIEKNGTTNVKFYFDGVLKKTLTSDLPNSGIEPYFNAHIINKANNNTLYFYVGPVRCHANYTP